jgi:AcrR family transcriptional regulator
LGRLAAWFAPSVIRRWYLYIVKISVTGSRNDVKQNLYSVKIAVYNFFMTARFGSAKKPLVANAPVRKRVAKSAATKKRAASAAAATYHHGDLREALLKAAEKILERDGLTGLTLRAVAREAGVSHAAPAHHFGDLTGLVSELAAIGFRQFNAAMIAADAAGITPIEKARARANNYVGYARAHPGMYTLMFRTERLDMSRPALKEAANASFASLVGAVGAGRRERIAEETLTLDQAADIVRAWSLVHGFTTLLLDDRLSDVLRRLPAGNDADTLLLAMLRRANTPMVPQS